MEKERIRNIASGIIFSLIELDFQNGIENFECHSIEDYCKKILDASREEIEEILGMNMEEIDVVERWLSKKSKK